MVSNELARDPDVFSVDLKGLLRFDGSACSLVYSPLTCHAFLADERGLAAVGSALRGGECPDADLGAFVRSIRDWRRREHPEIGPVLDTLAILPTSACNFSCSYCYARDSRTSAALSLRQATASVDAFLDHVGDTSRRISVSIMGGGEPTLFPGLADLFAHVRRRERERGVRIDMQLVSNGSLLTDERIGALLENRVVLVCSFEILEGVQNSQRGHYECVRDRLTAFLRRGGAAIVRATVTPASVEFLPEMAEELLRSYRDVKKAVFEPVLDIVTIDDADKLASFLNRFANRFSEARTVAEHGGLALGTSLLQRVDAASRRFCNPEWCVTPDGSLSVCHRLSGEGSSAFGSSLFGRVAPDGSVVLNPGRFEALVREDGNDRPRCRSCLARWNCAGGCRCQNLLFTPEMRDVRCDFTRRFLLDELLRRLEKTITGTTGRESELRTLLRERKLFSE